MVAVVEKRIRIEPIEAIGLFLKLVNNKQPFSICDASPAGNVGKTRGLRQNNLLA